jgi:hypothetical protein
MRHRKSRNLAGWRLLTQATSLRKKTKFKKAGFSPLCRHSSSLRTRSSRRAGRTIQHNHPELMHPLVRHRHPLGRAPTHSATSDLGRNISGNGPTTNTYVAARSPEGTACGLAGGRTAREISRSVPSGCGGSARSPRGRNVTRPRESRRKSNLEAHAEQSQKNSVLAYRFSCAYKSPAFRSLNSSRHAGLTQRLTIRVHP